MSHSIPQLMKDHYQFMDYQTARKRFAAKIRVLRNEKGLTQEQLAEMVEKTVEHISFLERAERSPSFEALIDLANALGVPVAALIDSDHASALSIMNVVAVEPISAPPPDPIVETQAIKAQQASDLERLNLALAGIEKMQELADEYGIHDILQDNGGKVLQVLILLGLRISPGREGNDAVDADGNEYELKTINRLLNKNAGITTHHHLNQDILKKYRAVTAWYIAIYEGVKLQEIYRVPTITLEPLFQQWEQKIVANGTALNNPKIPLRFVRAGEQVYPNKPPEVQQTMHLPT